jgi:DNA-directed RNA polymerase II subunit RPB2
MTNPYEESIFEKARQFLERYDSASIQKKSFDFFIHHRLPRIIEEEPTLNIPLPDGKTYRVSFGQVFVDKPYIIDENRQVRYITPNEARLRELTYSSLISVNIRTSMVTKDQDDEDVEEDIKEFFKIHLARIPMMIGTSKCNIYDKNVEDRCHLGECKYDTGGYFIVKGKERALITQERMNYNMVYVFEQRANSKFSMIAEIRSMSDETGHSVLVQMKLCNDVNMKVMLQIPYITQEVSLGYVFRAYGFTIDEIITILKANLGEKYHHPQISKIVKNIIRDAEMIDSPEKALHSISQYAVHTISKERRVHYVFQILNSELFPHLGITSYRNHKGFFLGHVLQKLLATYIKERCEDDRDHLNNKRFEAAGHLMSELFRTLFKRFVRAMEPQLVKRPDVLVIMSRMNMITQGVKHCFSTGNWGIPKSSYIRTGVSQILSRLTYNAFLSHLRRVIIPIGKEGKNTKIRQIHSSQIGFICPSETPEGHSAGIVKNLTVICQVSTKTDPTYLRMVLESTPGIVCRFDFENFQDNKPFYRIFLNGNWIGISYDEDIFNKILDHRRCCRFPKNVSLSFNDEKEIMIFGDEGRLIRPVMNARKMPTIDDLRTKSLPQLFEDDQFVFIDPHEIENAVIAMYPNELTNTHISYDYCEIHPSLLVSLCVGLIPFVDHTQAPRITYHASMGKQAIGLYATTNNIRTDTIAHVLTYPEKPLVKTHISEATGCDEMASGNNMIVAIAMYSGFNQEDSVILNKSSIQRGMLRSMGYRTIVVEERKKSTMLSESIELPSIENRIKSFNFSKLDEHGIVKAGVFVGSGDVIVARVQVKTSKQTSEEKTDASVIIKSGEEGYVDRVFVSTSPDGYKIVKIKIRSYKIPEIGDKVCSRNAQKGTVGVILPQEDMPFTSSGMVPDIIINPLCLPSRMTINQVIECVAGKVAVLSSRFKYSTAFSKHSNGIVDTLCSELHSNGFQKHGYETMYNGFTGEKLEAQIFIGPTYYQRLKHLVGAKIHARNHGSIQALTRQPLEGRSRDGGLRFGEMEKDTIWGEASISLNCGLSIRLKNMVETGWEVLGWSKEDDGIITATQTAFLDKGIKPCVEMTLEDGRKIKCTPDHPMLSSGNEWIRAKDLKVGQHRLKVGVNYPLMEIDQEISNCKGWSMDIGSIHLTTISKEEYLRTLAFMRILGWLVTDGGLYCSSTSNCVYGSVSLGHMIDVRSFIKDLEHFCVHEQINYQRNDSENRTYKYYCVRFPNYLTREIIKIKGMVIGRKVNQDAVLPEFVLKPDFPVPLLREFLGAMFGGDGHTCTLGMHRGKRDILTSISFSKSRTVNNIPSLDKMMLDMVGLLNKCGINNITIQNKRETTHSKNKHSDKSDTAEERCYQSTLHLDISELIPFSQKIGFRHCCHKSQRLEAAVSYKRLRNEVTRQHNWLTHRVDEITDFSKIKLENPNKIVPTKKAIQQAVEDLKKIEPLLHEYAIPSTHDITDHLIKGTQFGKFTSKSFPNAEEYIKKIDALEWFIDDETKSLKGHTCYAVSRDCYRLPTMNLTVLDVRPCAPEKVYDIEVERINSFLADGIVAHNCMISHGVSRFLTERLFDMSDKFTVPVCTKCGTMPNELNHCMMCNSIDISRVPIPYACKLLFQELQAMGIKTCLLPEAIKGDAI